MFITDTRPVKVNGFVVPYDYSDRSHTLSGNRKDLASSIICRMDNGAVTKALQGALRGHGNYTRIHGNKGLMESLRTGNKGRMRVWREPWEDGTDPDAAPPEEIQSGEQVYTPEFPKEFEEAAKTGCVRPFERETLLATLRCSRQRRCVAGTAAGTSSRPITLRRRSARGSRRSSTSTARCP